MEDNELDGFRRQVTIASDIEYDLNTQYGKEVNIKCCGRKRKNTFVHYMYFPPTRETYLKFVNVIFYLVITNR